MLDHEISGAREWELEEEKLPQLQGAAITRDDDIDDGYEDDDDGENHEEVELVDTSKVAVPKPSPGIGGEATLPFRTLSARLTQAAAPLPSELRNIRHVGSSTSSNKAACNRGVAPSDIFRLAMPFGHLRERVAEYLEGLGPGGGSVDNFLFEKINQETGAYIPRPKKLSDQFLQIWGNPHEVNAARNALTRLIKNRCQGTSKKYQESFAKIPSYSESKEDRLNQVDKHSIVMEQLRRKPDPSFRFKESLLFLWPTDEVPMDLALGPQLEALDPLRLKTGCCIYIYEELPTYIRVDSDNHDTIIYIVHCLRAKWAEAMAQIHIQAKLYLVQSASEEVRKNEVEVIRVAHSVGGRGYDYPTPILYWTPLTAMKLDLWQEQEKDAGVKNERDLREAVTKSLQGLRFLRGHVRMRINFGTFVLDDYRVPKEGKGRYTFNEFRTMLLNPRTKGHLVQGLEFNCGDIDLMTKCDLAKSLISPLAGPNEADLEQPEPCYAVNFEFQGNETLLRLEVEFAKSPSTNQFEVYQKRWIHPQGEDKAGDKRPALQIVVIDFERSDWQLEIKALEFQEPSSIEKSLREFSHSVRLNSEKLTDLRGIGEPRVSFSNCVPVARRVEKSALRYRLKGTNYVFELARYDEYRRTQLSAAQLLLQGQNANHMSTTPVTSWGASIYDLQWDNMLGQQANFGVGHNADWNPSLNTFFPCFGDADPSNLHSGFDSFIPLVKQVASLLGPDHGKDCSKSAMEPEEAQTDARSPSPPLVKRLDPLVSVEPLVQLSEEQSE